MALIAKNDDAAEMLLRARPDARAGLKIVSIVGEVVGAQLVVIIGGQEMAIGRRVIFVRAGDTIILPETIPVTVSSA